MNRFFFFVFLTACVCVCFTCRFGEIKSIRVMHERFCAFVNFENASMAASALEMLKVIGSTARRDISLRIKYILVFRFFFIDRLRVHGLKMNNRKIYYEP